MIIKVESSHVKSPKTPARLTILGLALSPEELDFKKFGGPQLRESQLFEPEKPLYRGQNPSGPVSAGVHGVGPGS